MTWDGGCVKAKSCGELLLMVVPTRQSVKLSKLFMARWGCFYLGLFLVCILAWMEVTSSSNLC